MNQSRSPVAFGKYVITRRIARGGMAEIYRARTRAAADHPSQWVAVKMMRSSLGHEELRERLFEREARIASKLHHANVIPIFEYGQEMDRPFLAMEYVRGRDLSHLLKNEKKGRGLLSFEIGLHIGYLASRGLGHAHRLTEDNGQPLGIVHRDISPGNVMVGYDGSVKVLDFGVARMNETQGVHTQTGTLRGKFAYMSPEQTLGEDLDARSDVFSLGTVLYELLTGINCFRAQNPIATLERVQGLRPVPPSRANRAIPKSVDRILARCLAKDKKRRFKDAQALCEAIGDFLQGEAFDGREALVAHMSDAFSWEKHEEESELLREEEEVALFDVVDFAALRDDTGLDARHIAISQQEEASQSEVKKVGAQRQVTDDADVFQAGSTSAPDQHSELEDESPTLAQPGIFDDNIQGRALQVSSLLEAAELPPAPPHPDHEEKTSRVPLPDHAQPEHAQPDRPLANDQTGPVTIPGTPNPKAVPIVPPPPRVPQDPAAANAARSNPMFAPAGVNFASALTDADTVDPTVMRPTVPPPPVYRRPPIMIAAIAFLVIGVAVAVTYSTGDDPTKIETREAPTMIDPVTITLDVDERKRVRPAPAPSRPRRPPTRALEDPPPGEDPAPVARAPRRRPTPKVRAVTKRRDVARRRANRRAAKKSSATGYLNVGAKPWGQIKIDGKSWPYQTPQAGIELPTGKHTVTLFNPKTGVSRRTVVYIKNGAYKTVMMDLRKK